MTKQSVTGHYLHTNRLQLVPISNLVELLYSTVNLTEFPDMTRCVCRPCDSDLRRGLRGKYPVGQTFTPQWKVCEEKKKGRQNLLCCIPGCTTKSSCNCRFATFDTICNAVEVSTSIAEGSIVSPFPLCMPHYKSVYKYCHPSPKCVCCGRIQKHRASLIRFRQCTNPMKVETYLKETGCLEEPLTQGALLCDTCAVFFNHPSNNYLSESNESIIKELNKKVFELKQHFEVNSTEEKNALLQSGEGMLNDKAFTFPQIYQQFCYFQETVSDDTSLSVSRGGF